MSDDAFESRVLRFERAWGRGGPPVIAGYLEDLSSEERSRLLAELVCIDLEFRWRSAGISERFRVDDYRERFPEWAALGPVPLELVGEEYRARHRWGDRPPHEEFLARFPQGEGPLRALLVRIDGELAEESATTGDVVRPPVRLGHPAEPTDVPLLSDRDFLLRRMIGAGRMGKVYEADWRGEGLAVAVKFLRKSFVYHPRIVRRFLDEARTVAGLRHPNIVGTQGLGRTGGGSYFLVMDLMQGPNLAEHVGEKAVAVAEAVRWVIEACDAVEYAHHMGIIHCDLKPANLLLDDTGTIRVADFGLARSLTDDTRWTAEVEGTAPFMAPEQAARCWGPIDRRTDVYGIGAVLFSLLTGRPPIVGRRLPDILAAVASAAPIVYPALLRPGLPTALVDVCLRCLRKAPADRYAMVGEVRSALAGIGLRGQM